MNIEQIKKEIKVRIKSMKSYVDRDEAGCRIGYTAGRIDALKSILKLLEDMTKEEEWIEEGKKIEEIFNHIKSIVETYQMQNYPAAPDPNLYIEEIEKKIKEFWKLGE